MAAPGPASRPAAPIPFRWRSRVVAWAKVILPLGALALLSTVFLLARAPGRGLEDDVPFARLDEIAQEPRIDAPRLSGVAEDGTALVLWADRIAPGARADDFTLSAPRLEASGPAGRVTVEARTGEVDGPGQLLHLSGEVRLAASGGYAARLRALSADLRAGTLMGEGPVTAIAPFGTLSAGGLTFAATAEGDGTQGAAADGGGRARLVFNGGVRLLYRPPTPAGAAQLEPEAQPR